MALRQSLAGAKWIVASPLDPTRGPPSKTLILGACLRRADFSRFLTHLVLWNSTDGHSVQDADLTNTIKTLLIHRNPQKTSQNEGFRMVAGGPRSNLINK